jgi:hypothetical protein
MKVTNRPPSFLAASGEEKNFAADPVYATLANHLSVVMANKQMNPECKGFPCIEEKLEYQPRDIVDARRPPGIVY